MSQGFTKNKNSTSVPQTNRAQRGTNNHAYSQRPSPPGGNITLYSNPEEYSRTQQITQGYLPQQAQQSGPGHPLVSPATASGVPHDMSQSIYASTNMLSQRPTAAPPTGGGPPMANHGPPTAPPPQPQAPPSAIMQQAPSTLLPPPPNQGHNLQHFFNPNTQAVQAAAGRTNLNRFPYMNSTNNQIPSNQLVLQNASGYPSGLSQQFMIPHYGGTARATPSYGAPFQQTQYWSIGPSMMQQQLMQAPNSGAVYIPLQMLPNNTRMPLNPTTLYAATTAHQVPAPPEQAKREKKLIEIRDPDSLKIVDLSNAKETSNESPHQINPTAVEFKNRVAQEANSGKDPLTVKQPTMEKELTYPQGEFYPASFSPVEEPEEIMSYTVAAPPNCDVVVPLAPPLQEEDLLSKEGVVSIAHDEASPPPPVEPPQVVDLSEEEQQVPPPLPPTAAEEEAVVEPTMVMEEEDVVAPRSQEEPTVKRPTPPPVVVAPPPIVEPVPQAPVPQPTRSSAAKPEAKEKPKKKNKKHDYNKRAEEKEGSDMDAFLLEEKIAPKTITPPPPPPPTSEPHPAENDVELEELKKEEKMVAEKNEENARMSAADESAVEASVEVEPPQQEAPPAVQLKYIYEDDQWSPINPGGQKKYGRDFLLKMQYDPVCLKKPDLPMVEIIRDTPNAHKLPETKYSSQVILPGRDNDPFMPNFVRSNNQMSRSGGGMKRGRGPPSQDKTKKIIIAPSVPQTVELRTTENAWKPMSRIADVNKEETQDEKIYREVRSILNKLTPEKFNSLLKQLQQVQIDTVERLEGVINLVFEKAVDEPKFAVPYANMCKHLAKIKVKVDDSDNTVNFRKLLLTKCQKEFEKDYKDDEKLAKIQKDSEMSETEEKRQQKKEEYEDQLRKARRRSLGNIRFIGELYKLGMLTAPIMHDCLKRLLSQQDEDSLECFCHLIHTIGQNLAQETRSKPGLLKHGASMEEYFKTVKSIVSRGDVSSRIKFLILDTIEFKENNYVSTRISTPAQNNPTTIASIHQEAQREALKAQQEMHMPKRQDDRDRKKGKGRSGSNYQSNQSDDGWNTTSRSSKKEFGLEPSKKLSKLDAESLQFGRGGSNAHSWARGSSGGAKQAETAEKQAAMCTNRYSALASNEAESHRHRGGQRSAASSRESSRNGARQMAPPGIRKSLSQTSATHEKEQVINALKTIVKGSHSQKLLPSESPQETKTVQKPPTVPSLEVMLAGGDLSEDDIEKEVRSMYEEYVSIGNSEEIVILLTEKASPSTIEAFIMSMMNLVLDRNDKAREMFGTLANVLLARHIITPELFKHCLSEMVLSAESLAIDYPRIEEYMAQMVVAVFLGKELPATFLCEVCQECLHTKTSSKIVTHLLKMAAKQQPVLAAERWHSASLQLADFLPPEADVQEHIATHKLEFLSGLQPLETLLNNNCSNQDAIDWIEKNIVSQKASQPKFIRALTTTILKSGITGSGSSCSADMEVLKSRLPILQKFIDHKEGAELEAIYAIQVLMAHLEHPKDLICALFTLLEEEEVINEESFLKWKNCREALDNEGRAMALVSSQRFFQELQESQEE